MKVRRKKGFYSISAVAKMFEVHQQTIRLYEKEGLITPKRTEGNTRLFSEEDIDRLEEIIDLTQRLGVNLAGVEKILELQKRIAKMQKEMNKLFDQTKEQLLEESEQNKQVARTAAKQLVKLKQQTINNMPAKAAGKSDEQIIEVENWDVEYDED